MSASADPMGDVRRIRNLETGVVMEVSASHADYLLTGGPNALAEFVPGFEPVDDDTPCGPPAEVIAAAPPAGTHGGPHASDESEGEPEGEQPEGEESEGEQPEGDEPEPGDDHESSEGEAEPDEA